MAESGDSNVEQETMHMFDTDNLLADLNWPDIVITPRQKRARENLSIGQKRDICLYREANPHCKQHKLKEFCLKKWGINIGRSTVSDILKNKDKWLEMPKDAGNIYRLNFGRHTKLEEQLYKWTMMMKARFPTMTVTDAMMKRQARVLGMRLQIDKVDKNFAYSSGWLQKFKKRYGLLTKGKRGSCDGIKKLMHNALNSEQAAETNDENDVIDEGTSLGHIDIEPAPSHVPNSEQDEHDEEMHTENQSNISIKEEPESDFERDSGENSEGEANSTLINQNTRDLHCPTAEERILNTAMFNAFPAPPRLTINPHIINRISNDEAVPVSGPIISTFSPENELFQFAESNSMHQTMEVADSSPPGKRMRTDIDTESSRSTVGLRKPRKSRITAQDARSGVVRCIRFIERAPELSDYLDILWEVYDSLESHNGGTSKGQTTMDQFFKKI